MLLGREAELSLLGARIARLGSGRPFVCTIRGEPGSGRSALLGAARDLAADAGAVALAARGPKDGGEVAFSGLASLLRPLDADLDTFAGDGAGALRAAVALGGQEADGLAVRVAVLRVLTAAAGRGPVLLTVDDADRLDAGTVAALTFALGRLGSDPVGTVVVTGAGPGPLDNLTDDVLPLAPLTDADLAAIVIATVPCTDAVAATVASWADGSPLLAVELARSLSADERAGRAPLPDAPRPTVLLVERLQAELAGLDEPAQRAAVVVAADRTGRVGAIVGALAALGEPADALDRAEAAGAVVVDGDRVRFRHPLLRPLAYRLVAAASRRAAHRALAVALDAPEEAAERARQLVASCAGPDEAVAGALELVAASEQRRGAPAAAATTWEEAARLSVDAKARTRRWNAAAAAHLDALEVARARAVARDVAATGDEEALLLGVEAVERGEGPAAALGVAHDRGDVRADLLLAAGKVEDARAELARSGAGADGELAAVLRAALDESAPLPPEPTGDRALARRARRRWLLVAATRGTAPPSPSTVDELAAAAVAARAGNRPADAAAMLDRATSLVPPDCAGLRAWLADLAGAPGAGDALAAALSAAELRVAEAVASGLTNRQAGDLLYLSAKTVDFHLQTIYRKLGIRSRAELATRVATRHRPA